MDYVLRTNALCKKYRDFKALNGLSMNVPKGAIYGFVGKKVLARQHLFDLSAACRSLHLAIIRFTEEKTQIRTLQNPEEEWGLL